MIPPILVHFNGLSLLIVVVVLLMVALITAGVAVRRREVDEQAPTIDLPSDYGEAKK